MKKQYHYIQFKVLASRVYTHYFQDHGMEDSDSDLDQEISKLTEGLTITFDSRMDTGYHSGFFPINTRHDGIETKLLKSREVKQKGKPKGSIEINLFNNSDSETEIDSEENQDSASKKVRPH